MVSRLRVSSELIELQSFSAASTATGSCTQSAPWEHLLKPHCREGAGAATRASHHTGLCYRLCFPNTHMILMTNYLEVLQPCPVQRTQTQQPRGWVWGNWWWRQQNPDGRTCKEGQQGPLWGQKGEQLTVWAAFTAHHLSSSKGENGRLNGLLGCSLYKGQEYIK